MPDPVFLKAEELEDDWQPFPGAVVLGLPNSRYHALPGASKSGLDAIDRSPHYYHNRHLEEQTDAMAMGTLRHTLTLEPELFDDQYYVVADDVIKNAKHKKYQEILEAANGREVIKRRELKDAREIAHAVHAVEDFKRYWDDTASAQYVEPSVWSELGTEVNGVMVPVLVKCRPDFLIIPTDEAQPLTCFDLKTMADSSEESVRYQGEKMRKWPKAGAYYSDILNSVWGRGGADWVLVAIQYGPIKEVNLYVYSMAGIRTVNHQIGEIQYRRSLALLAKCEQSDRWPTSTGGIKKMEPSHYAAREISND